MRSLRDRDGLFKSYRYQGTVTLAILDPADPPNIARGRPAEERDKYSKPHWDETTSQIKTNTVGGKWAYQSFSGSHFAYSSDPNEPLITTDSVTFLKSNPAPADVNMSVVAGHHPVLGLGLGDLMDAKLRITKGRLTLYGHLPQRGEITATFANPQATELKELVISDGKSLSKTYSYGPYVSLGGPPVPETTDCAVSANGHEFSRAHYVAEHVAPEEGSAFEPTPWFKPGYTFFDQRVDPPVNFSYEELVQLNGGAEGLTPQRLLSFSRAKASRLQAVGSPKSSRKSGGAEPAFVALAGGLLLGLLIAGCAKVRGSRG